MQIHAPTQYVGPIIYIYIYIFYWHRVSEAFALTNPKGAQALHKEFPASASRIIQGSNNIFSKYLWP